MTRTVVAGLGLLLIIQLGLALRGSGPRTVAVGEAPEIEAYTLGGDAFDVVSEGSGLCHVVVLASPDCGACAAARDRWVRDGHVVALAAAAGGAIQADASPGWRSTWVLLADSAKSADFVDSRLPSNVRYTDDHGLVRRFGLSTVPSHLIFDRQGRLASVGRGAPFPSGDVNPAGCALASSESRL